MSNYTKTTDFEAKDSLPSGDSGKIIRGSEFETEFDNISTAIATKADAANPTFTGTVTIDGLTVNGNTVLGNAASDTVTVTADIASNLLPSADDTYNLGAVGAEWNDLYVDGVAYIDTINGFATTGDVNFGDNNKAQFGAGNDLQIFHDGSNSRIKDNGTGGLYVQGSSFISLTNASATETYVYAAENGAVQLKYDNATKLATTSTGIDVTGVITTDGMTTSADINFGDNDKAVFGAGSDLQIYHNGNNSFITDTGTGSLYVRASDALRIQTATSEEMLKAEANGAVTAYYDNIARLATTSAGIDVTGTVTADGLTVEGTTAFNNNNVNQTGTAPKYNFFESDITNLNSQLLSSGGKFFIRTLSDDAGTVTKRFQIDHSTGDISFFEDTGTTAKFFWDSSAERLGIGTTSPDADLDVRGTTLADVHIRATSANSIARALLQNDAQAYALRINSDDKFRIKDETADADRLVIDTSGNVGIGTDSPDTLLEIVGADPILTIRDSEFSQSATNATLRLAESGGADSLGNYWDINHTANGVLRFVQDKDGFNNERIRIDASGNLLVGKISTGTTNVGTQITGDGFTSIVGTNNNIPLYLENKGTNGNCRISFANNSHGGASLGLNNGGDFTIFDSTASTTRFNVTSSRVITASGGIAGIELGGVGVNNRLDDYEEGTFTPVVTGSTTAGTGTYSSQSGTYTKVGQVVTCSFAVNMTAHDGAGNIRISLPFSSNTNAVGVVMDQNLNYGSGASLVAFTQNQEFVQLYAVGDNLAWDVQTLADDTAFTLFVTITYRA